MKYIFDWTQIRIWWTNISYAPVEDSSSASSLWSYRESDNTLTYMYTFGNQSSLDFEYSTLTSISDFQTDSSGWDYKGSKNSIFADACYILINFGEEITENNIFQ